MHICSVVQCAESPVQFTLQAASRVPRPASRAPQIEMNWRIELNRRIESNPRIESNS